MARESQSNYMATGLSLASSLDMVYIEKASPLELVNVTERAISD